MPLKQLVHGLDIEKSRLLLLLDEQTLLDLGLTNAMFGRKIVRANTTKFYKQKRFNLLREQTEGYSKLIVEIYRAAYKKSNTDETIDNTASTIVSLIGYFDLDPVKSLDVFLDLTSSNLVAHSRFFIQVLKKSPWWPSLPAHPKSFLELGEGGNSMAAQIIGFKLQSFVENNEVPPENFFMMIAILIKEGFISLGSIYPYLDPPDETLVKIHSTWKRDMEDRAFSTNASALAMAAPLEDDSTADSGKAQSTESDKPKKQNDSNKYPVYQKVSLLHSLLAVGSIQPSLFMISRYPKIVDPYPEIADLLLKITEYSIDPLYNLRDKPPALQNLNLSVLKTIPTQESIQNNYTLTPPKNGISKRGLVPIKGVAEYNPPKFFYERWCSEIEQVHDLEGLKKVSSIYLLPTGPLVSRNIELLIKLCRIGVSFCRLEKDDNSEIITYWVEYTRNYILPAISLIEPNPGAIQEIFNLIRLFSFETRYSLYGEWQNVILKSSPHLKFASSKAEKDTKNVLKRLSNTNVREMMRKLAKVSYTNPISCFKIFIGQVESYDNLASLVVEAARYFTDLGWDVFPFIIMMQLTSGRGTLQMDGLNDRKWIQSLASFTAKLCRRYSYMDPRLLLLFLLRKLHSSDLSFVIVLRELISQMAGIAQLSNLTTTQVENLGGGSVLRSKVFESIEDEREVVAKAGRRLIEAFISLKIFSEMFIILNQLHQRFIHSVPEEMAYEKVMASRYDDLTHILIQFMEMATYYLDINTFKNNMTPIVELCIVYGVDVPYAFGIWRPYLGEEIRGFDPSQTETQALAIENANDGSGLECDKWHPVLRNIVRNIYKLYPEEEWKYLKPGFFVTFWQLSLYDIQYPSDKYVMAERKLSESITLLNDNLRTLENNNTRESIQQAKQIRTQRDHLSQQQAKLSAESKRHALHFEKSRSRLRSEKAYWFDYKGPEAQERHGVIVRRNITKQLLAKCVLPRALTSPIDAVFSARFIQLLHSIGTNNFSSLMFYDKLFSDGILYATLLTCTSYEAENLGLFLSEVLSKLLNWRQKLESYTDEGLGKRYVEDNVSFLPGLRFDYDKPETTEASLLSHSQFKTALEKWNKFTKEAIITCLKSDHYIHRSNAITLLRNTIEVFPIITSQGWEITDAIEDLATNETREDLKLMASALLVHLKRRSKDWIEIYNFKDFPAEIKEVLIKRCKKEAREREAKRNKRNTPLAIANSNNLPSKIQSPAPESNSTPAPTSGTQRRGSRSQPNRRSGDEKSISSNGLPASLPKIPSGPRHSDEPFSRPNATLSKDRNRSTTQISSTSDSRASTAPGRDRDGGRYDSRRGGAESLPEPPHRQSYNDSSTFSEKARANSSSRQTYRDEGGRNNSERGPSSNIERRNNRSGVSTPDNRSTDMPTEPRRGGRDHSDTHSRQQQNHGDGPNESHEHKDYDNEDLINRNSSQQLPLRMKEDNGSSQRRGGGNTNASGNGPNRDKYSRDGNTGNPPPKGPKDSRIHPDREERMNSRREERVNSRRDRDQELGRRDKERERDRDKNNTNNHPKERERNERDREKDQRARERERELRNREREKDRERGVTVGSSFDDRRPGNMGGGPAKGRSNGGNQGKGFSNIPPGPDSTKRGSHIPQDNKNGRGNTRSGGAGGQADTNMSSSTGQGNPNTGGGNSGQQAGKTFEERLSSSMPSGRKNNSGSRHNDREDSDKDSRRSGPQQDLRRGGPSNSGSGPQKSFGGGFRGRGSNQTTSSSMDPNHNSGSGQARGPGGGVGNSAHKEMSNNDRLESRQRNDKEREARRRERDGRSDSRQDRDDRGDRDRNGGGRPDRHRRNNEGMGGNSGGGNRGRKHMRSGDREGNDAPEKRRRMNR